jgi:TATA-binding protein-associated factor Taf7
MNERADNINGLVEYQQMLRLSPNLAERVHNEFIEAGEDGGLAFEIEWVDERHAKVHLGRDTYPGLLLDLPTVNEIYKMESKKRMYKSGDIGQMLIVHDPENEEDVAFFKSQRYDAVHWTLLSGITPPSTYIWSRVFKKQNQPPKNVDFAKVETDLSDVNILLKEDVEMEFIHPKELDVLYLKPGQSLLVDGIDIEPIEGKSVGEILKIKREETTERLKQQILEEKRLKKEQKKRKKQGKESGGNLVAEGERSSDVAQKEDASGATAGAVPGGGSATNAPPAASWQVAVKKLEEQNELESKIAGLNEKLKACKPEEEAALKQELEKAQKELASVLIH